jgi:hypothetical protein
LQSVIRGFCLLSKSSTTASNAQINVSDYKGTTLASPGREQATAQYLESLVFCQYPMHVPYKAVELIKDEQAVSCCLLTYFTLL